ncbi:oxygenase MpaB family protein [uncultured Sphingomonas sp.]|uniref:oxygenase MpaB family protein n=1 Tax=uncultured Sphingomonas sp. TaxID=158754 RepID=UPI0035CAF53F
MYWTLPASLDRALAELAPSGVDVSGPFGEQGLAGPDSVSWRIFRNPISMYVGGVAGVLLELGEPRVRHGVWDHSSFRRDPARRLRRTGAAAMVTVYGARSSFEALAARVAKMHEQVRGTTPAGKLYAAGDPELLRWVQATAAWTFLEAYRRWVRPVDAAAADRYFAEGAPGAALYGVIDPPLSLRDWQALADATAPRLEPSSILHELLAILRTAAILPGPLRSLQPALAAAAVELLPADLRHRLGLDRERRPTLPERAALRLLAAVAERTHIPSAPYAQASRRLGLAGDHLLRHQDERAAFSPAGAAPPRS